MDWTEKYRPRSLSEVRGNNKSVSELKEWAENWDEHREVAIVHGDPGVGKTSAVHALANDMGWDVTELNASDQRTSDIIKKVAGEASKSQSLTGRDTKRLIILDEADNLHGTADRGGARAVTEVVKSTRQPIVLIANDYYEVSNTLRRVCREIEFRSVSSRSILPVLRDICESEGIEYEKEALQVIADKNSGDLRGAINDLQAVAEGRELLTKEDVEDTMGSRDKTEGIFEFLDTLFKGEDMREALEKAREVDESPDDLIHWIDENLPKAYSSEELMDGYHNLSRSDVYLGRTTETQNYSLWRYANDMMIAGVQSAKKEGKGGWIRYGPPSTFRRLGQTRKKRSTRDSIARKVGESSLVSMSSARDDFIPYLRVLFENEDSAVALTAELGLNVEEVEFILDSSKSKAEKIVDEAGEGGSAVTDEEVEETEGAEETNDEEDEGEDESQSTLSSFE